MAHLRRGRADDPDNHGTAELFVGGTSPRPTERVASRRLRGVRPPSSPTSAIRSCCARCARWVTTRAVR
ncbi:MAG: hypothetical protein ACLSVD_02115 [Eggerthellaceae bacterium]